MTDALVAELAQAGAGVRPVSQPVDVAALEGACQAQGRPFVVLDTHAVDDKPAFMEAVAAAFELPDWFGRNWDAFADSLRDVPPETVVAWDGWTDLARTAPRACEVAIEVLAESGLTVLLVDAPAE
jgi:RNAse (barnase) inhibitor barstar